jgi:peptidyl-prolyl cis-trans isomerase A (cyclophilin A)
MNKGLLKSLILVGAAAFLFACNNPKTEEQSNDETTETIDTIGVIDDAPAQTPAAPITEENLPDGMYAKIETNNGTILLKLEMEKAPLTVANFVGLAEGKIANNFRKAGQPFYDGLMFHRVISFANGDGQNFMVQGGDPMGTGQGGPGYQFKDEFVPTLKHDKPGILSMANSGPGTNGSQFFITLDATSWLDGKHTVFGAVVEGQSVVNNMKMGEMIRKMSIIRKGDAAKAFDAKATFEKLK